MSDFMTFEGPTFTMQIPTNWFISSSPRFQAAFVSPEKEEEEEIFPNMLVAIRRMKEGANAPAVAKSAREKQQETYPDYKVLAEKEHSTDSVSAFERIYRWHNPDQRSDIQQWQAFYMHQNILYTLTATCSVTEKLPAREQIFEKMLGSFELLTE